MSVLLLTHAYLCAASRIGRLRLLLFLLPDMPTAHPLYIRFGFCTNALPTRCGLERVAFRGARDVIPLGGALDPAVPCLRMS